MARVRLISEAEIPGLLRMFLAREMVESVFRWSAAGQTVNRPRERMRAQGGVLQVMPAAVPEAGMLWWTPSSRPGSSAEIS